MAAMRRMAGSKPISSMRSTSSSTMIRIPESLTSLRLRKSSSRPGVATISRAPWRIVCSCVLSDIPPTTSAAVWSWLERMARKAFSTCMASSRVGRTISACAPRPSTFCSISTMGIKKLSVLPVPVCAVASTSRPLSAGGIASACTGVGVLKWLASSLASKDLERENCEN